MTIQEEKKIYRDTYRVKPAHFESKRQVAPNSVVFHRNLSDGAKLFILALNAIETCAPSWHVVQGDIGNRMGWGRDKTIKIVKECKSHGYLQVTQSITQDGRFSQNIFEFDIEGGYPIPEKQVKTPCPENPGPDMPTLLYLRDNHTYEKNNKQSPPKSPAPVAVSPDPVVVYSLSIDREKKEASIRAVCPEISQSTLNSITMHSQEQVENAIGALSQAKLKKPIPNPIGYLVSAVKEGWKTNKGTSQDDSLINEHKKLVKALDGQINRAKTVRIDYLTQHIEFVYITTSKAATCVKYGTSTFMQEVRNLLEKNGF